MAGKENREVGLYGHASLDLVRFVRFETIVDEWNRQWNRQWGAERDPERTVEEGICHQHPYHRRQRLT